MVFLMVFYMIFYGFFYGFFSGAVCQKFRETTATPAVRYLTTTTTTTILCSVLLFFLAVNSKIKYFSCSCTYSCYFYWVVSLGLVYFFPACGGQIVNGDIMTVKIKLRVCYNYFSPPAAGK